LPCRPGLQPHGRGRRISAGAYGYGMVAFSIGSKGYMGTGASKTTFWNDLWEYTPVNGDSGVWTQKATFPGTGRMWGTGFSIGSKGYVGMGVNFSSFYKDLYEYNQSNNTWTKKSDLPASGTGRDQLVSFSIAGKGYIGTGRNGTGKDLGI